MQSERSSSLGILGQSASEGPGRTFCGIGMSMDQSASEGPGKTFCGTGTSKFGLQHAPGRFFLAQHRVKVSYFEELHLLFHVTQLLNMVDKHF